MNILQIAYSSSFLPPVQNNVFDSSAAMLQLTGYHLARLSFLGMLDLTKTTLPVNFWCYQVDFVDLKITPNFDYNDVITVEAMLTIFYRNLGKDF